MNPRLTMAAVVAVGAGVACALAAHTALNLRHLRRPVRPDHDVDEPVSVLIPARDEAAHIATTVRSALAQEAVPHLEVLVLDDGSTDGTGELVAGIAAGSGSAADRLRLIEGGQGGPPGGWLGKPWACQRLAEQASGSILVFVDADVELSPDAIAALADLLRGEAFAMVAPYPESLAVTWLERLVQPLLTWSWAATLPLRWAETSGRPSLSAANGQLIAVDAAAYRAIGAHGAVRADVIEDVALMRALKRAGYRTSTVDGSGLARCRMYDGPQALVNGYAKSLWSAFGGPAGSVAVNALLLLAYAVPAVAMVAAPRPRTRLVGAVGYAAGVVSRVLVARAMGQRALPDALLHPLSILAFCTLNAVSWERHVRGANTWKGRPVVPMAASADGGDAEVAA